MIKSILPSYIAAINDSNSKELSSDATSERSEADKIVDGMNFGELCNEFECISSPAVEATARQLARDILELREGNRALGTFAVSVKYKVLPHQHTLSRKENDSLTVFIYWIIILVELMDCTFKNVQPTNASIMNIR